MKVLFVSSGNNVYGLSPIISNQGESLKRKNIDLDYFTIKGKGISGYLKNYSLLRKSLSSKYDIVHSHFFLSSVLASLTKKKPLVVSLMGSDVYNNAVWRFAIKIFNLLFWNALIVKTSAMKEKLNLQNAFIIPNGVNLKIFYPINKIEARKKLNLQIDKKYILFGSNPERSEKNYALISKGLPELKNYNVDILSLFNQPKEKIVLYLNAADMLVLTSFYEGSPNIIKEAMACNCPIVSTDVGDVKWIIGNVKGCFISSFDIQDFVSKIELALEFIEKNGRTNGRERIIELGLDDETIADKIIEIYNEVLKKNGSPDNY